MVKGYANLHDKLYQKGWDDHYNGYQPKPPKHKIKAKVYEKGRLDAIRDQNEAENPDYRK